MNEINYNELCSEVIHISKEVGSFILKQRDSLSKNDVKYKTEFDLVTFVDIEAEKMIVNFLKEKLPQAGFITEEGVESKKANRFNWIIDPLDGTTNFIYKVPIFCTSIALMENDKIVLGVIYDPNRDECFYAYKDSPAFLNGKIINVSKASKLSECVIITEFPNRDFENIDKYLDIFKFFINKSVGIRRLGSAALDLAYTACGRFSAIYEYGLYPWDVAAGSFIIQQAGGYVTNFMGEDDFIFKRQVLAANPVIHSEMFKEIKKHKL